MKYAAKKIGLMLLTMVIVSFLAFLAFQVIPGDPAVKLLGTEATPERIAALRAEMGLDRPFLERYVQWVLGALHGDFGTSYSYKMPVSGMLAGKLPVTGLLTGMSFVLILVFSIPLGIFTARHAGGRMDKALTSVNQVLMAIPAFVTGILLTYVFGLVLRWFVPGNYVSRRQLRCQPVVFSVPGRVHCPAQGGHDREDAALIHSVGDGKGLCPHVSQPGQQRPGYPVPPCAAQCHGAGGVVSGHDRSGYCGGLCGYRAGIFPAGPGLHVADVHRQPGPSRGAGGGDRGVLGGAGESAGRALINQQLDPRLQVAIEGGPTLLLNEKKNHYLRAGLVLTGLMAALALLGCVWTPYPPTAMSGSEKFAAPCLRHLFGTDNFGRDIFSRVLAGAGTTFLISAATVVIGAGGWERWWGPSPDISAAGWTRR